jgi:caffeoyl-CoA O-methyltransferase
MDRLQQKEKYIIDHCTAEDPVLSELNRQTHLRMLNSRMISGHYQGKFLEMISHMIRPGQILEIGTFTGYSAICMARGLAANGMLHTIDINDEISDFALDYFRKSGMDDRITLHTGNAIDIIPTLDGPFDLVFIDGEKSEYLRYYELVFPKVRQGGFIVADNVLWDDKVYRQEYRNDEYTMHIDQFNKAIAGDHRVENMIVALRDGLMLVRKK